MERISESIDGDGATARSANEVLVVAAMALVALATGIGAYFEANMAAWLSAAMALGVFAVLIGVHLAVRRPARFPRTDIGQLEEEIAKLNAGHRAPPPTVTRPIPIAVARVPGRDDLYAPARPERAGYVGAARDGAPPRRETHASPLALPQPVRVAVSVNEARADLTPREADVEMVQGLVRKLADQVSAAEATASRDAASVAPKMDGAIEASLEALRATADTMRIASGLVATAPPEALRDPAPDSPRSGRALMLAEALTAGRAELLLEPILNLEDRRVRHYGVAMRLKAPDGAPLGGEAGRDPEDAAFGPAIDGLRLARTALLARRLAERGKLGFIFFDVGAAALGSDRYVAEVAALCQEPAAWVRQLVPTLTQADVAAFTTKEWDSLRDFGKAGLCFSLRGVESLDMNFAVIKTWGFAFVEIEASRFLDGLPRSGKPVGALEATRHLIDAGLTPIVSGLDEDAKLTPIVAAGALLGRGPLFGAPRPVKSEALHEAGQHAA